MLLRHVGSVRIEIARITEQLAKVQSRNIIHVAELFFGTRPMVRDEKARFRDVHGSLHARGVELYFGGRASLPKSA